MMMNILGRSTRFVMLALFFWIGALVAGCEEGPVEEAGEEIDDALDDAGAAFD